MSSHQPWNNIPKVNNSKAIMYSNSKPFKFDNKTTYLPRGLGRSYGDVCLNNNGSLIYLQRTTQSFILIMKTAL